jgi:prolycopene isomerase
MMATPVTGIHVERGAVRGVELLAGPVRARRTLRVAAPIVVANGDLRRTLEELLGPTVVDPSVLARVRTLRPSYPCFLMHVGLRDVSTDLLHERQGYYWDSWDSDRVGSDGLRFKLFVPTLYDPSLAPPGGHVLIVQKVQELDYAAIDDWASHKREVERFVMSRLEQLMPGIGAHMVVRLSATAATHQRYTWNHQGAMLGWEMSPDQLGHGRFDVDGDAQGLYFVGHWVRPGGGITPALVSAIEAVRRIVGSRPSTSAVDTPFDARVSYASQLVES